MILRGTIFNRKEKLMIQADYVIGIDPGKGGAGVLIDASGRYIEHFRGDDTQADQFAKLEGWQLAYEPCLCIVESVHSMPKQGISSSFKFGMGFGFLLGIVTACKIRYEKVSPQKWQGAMKCRSKGNKNITKAKAQELFPQVKVTHIIADALLLAEYARRIAIERGYITK